MFLKKKIQSDFYDVTTTSGTDMKTIVQNVLTGKMNPNGITLNHEVNIKLPEETRYDIVKTVVLIIVAFFILKFFYNSIVSKY